MRELGPNVIDLNAHRPHPVDVAPHPMTQTMRTQLDWMTRVLNERVGELIADLNAAAANGEATDPEGAARLAYQLGETFAGMRARFEALPDSCIVFPLARSTAKRSPP